jgi:hypothetical protein
MGNNFMGSTVAAAVTAAVFSPKARQMLRKGAVQGLAGVLIAGDALSSFARGVGRGLQAESADPQPNPSDAEAVREAARAAQEAAKAAQAAAEAAQSAAARPKASPRTRKKTAPNPEASTRTRKSEA